ncbi:MAG: inorganic diphosphatase [Saprospiraceae bacterium]|nr:inorganic diphosphatase [Saprospiraceae bacterium]
MRPLLLCIAILWGLTTCTVSTPDYAAMSWQGENGIRMVVEIPAGTNLKNEWNKESGMIMPDQINGADRYIDFLPYPGNYGFIPGTLMDVNKGGDGDPLDALVIGANVPAGTIQEFIPIGLLDLKDDGETDIKIIGVPALVTDRVINATHFDDFLIHYDAARRIIEEWFLHYKGYGKMELVGWQDDKAAHAYIKTWSTEQ